MSKFDSQRYSASNIADKFPLRGQNIAVAAVGRVIDSRSRFSPHLCVHAEFKIAYYPALPCW